MQKQKVTITIAMHWLDELDLLAKSRRTNRSALIEEALKIWRREQIKRELSEGYRAMAAEDLRIAEQNLGCGVETLE